MKAANKRTRSDTTTTFFAWSYNRFTKIKSNI